MSDTITEQELLERLRKGDKGACALCIDMYGTQIYRLALRLMKNEADAEDVVQETFMNAYKSIDKFEGRSGLNTWLYRIAYNAAMMRLRRPSPYTLSIDETLQTETPTPIPHQLFDWCCLPEREFETAETRTYLEQSITELPEKLRVVFMLRELEELSTQETADILDISVDAVKKRLHRARLWLRERLSTHFAEQPLI
jgi:RNA polymerase sigma-70 factor (ECF subfamily)